MSSSQYVASVTNGTIGTIYFNVAKTERGRILDRLTRIYEELQAPGVDGRRWRLKNQVFPDFQMQTYADFNSYSDATNEARRYSQATGQYMNLIWSAGNFAPLPYISVKILSTHGIVMAGQMGGFGVSNTSGTAFVMGNWQIAVLAQEGVTP